MKYKKEGMPSEGDVVVCVVKTILHNSVFVSLDEYKNKEGIIHISEISPGRIRTIRDYVKEGKTIICKVLRVKDDNIILSLRRVSGAVKAKKLEELKVEEKSEKVLEVVAKNVNMPFEDLYKSVGVKIIEEFGSLASCFQELVKSNQNVLAKMGVEKKVEDQIIELVKQRFKPPEVKMVKKVIIKNPSPNGIDRIKEVFTDVGGAAKKNGYNVVFSYLGSPQYRMVIVSSDYKSAEKAVADMEKWLTEKVVGSGGEIEFVKEK